MFLLIFFINVRNRLGNEKKELYGLWETGNYEETFRMSGAELQNQPMDFFLLTIHGFSAYQLGIAQINTFDTLNYIDECIRSLRKAMLLKKGTEDGRVYYVLGKAYYYKGQSYADLAVKYLEMARNSYPARDIPEYLGLAYAAIQDYRNSIAAFTQALEPGDGNPSDPLLLSIASSYMALEELESARAYLIRCIDTTRDAASLVKARLLMGEILRKSGNEEEAEVQYMTILDETGENAETHYQLGELYDSRGDTTRARAEWRRTVRIDPAHIKARKRLNM
jgi:tetratricopeptide (TPR) repeat protein